MKKPTQLNTLKRLGTAMVMLGLSAAVPIIQADDDKVKVKAKEEKVKIKGKDARELLKPEVTSTFVDGYTIPNEYQTYFTEVPAAEGDSVVVRYLGGRAYYINSADWKITRIVDLDSSNQIATDNNVFVEGYVIPDSSRTQFINVPSPDAGMNVRNYNNTAYYMDSSYRIVRVVPLMP